MTETATKGARVKSMDVFKGFAIIAVMSVHLLFSSTAAGRNSTLPVIVQALYLGLMGFFVISGYFYRPSRGFSVNMMKRLTIAGLGYMLCALVLPLILCAEMWLVGPNVPSWDEYLESCKWVYGSPALFQEYTTPMHYANCAIAIGHYFIQVMLVTFLVFYAIAERVVCSRVRTAIAIIILLVIECALVEIYPNVLPFHIQLVPMGTAFMLLGAAVGKEKVVQKMEAGAWKEHSTLIVLAVCAVIAGILCFFFQPGTAFNESNFGKYGGYSAFPYFIESIPVLMLEFFICILLSKIPYVSDVLSYVGRHTFSLIMLQGFVVKLLLIPFFELSTTGWFPTMDMPVKLVLILCSIILPIVISDLVLKVADRLGILKKLNSRNNL